MINNNFSYALWPALLVHMQKLMLKFFIKSCIKIFSPNLEWNLRVFAKQSLRINCKIWKVMTGTLQTHEAEHLQPTISIHSSNFIEISLCCNSIYDYLITSNICTCHSNIAAMTCAEFGSNPFNIIWIKNKLKCYFNLYGDGDIYECTKISQVSGGLPVLDIWSHECWSLVTHMCGWTGSSLVPVMFFFKCKAKSLPWPMLIWC